VRRKTTGNQQVAYRTILHLDEEGVRALVVEVRPESVLVIGASEERRMDPGSRISAATLAPVCEDAIRRAEDMTERAIGHLVVPDEAIIGVPDRHICCTSGQVQAVRAQPDRRIEQDEINRLLARLCNANENLAAIATRQPGREPASFELLETRIADMRVDGQSVTSPLGFRGQRIEGAAIAFFVECALMNELRLLVDYMEIAATAVPLSWALAHCLGAPESLGLILEQQETILFLWQRGTVVALDRCAYGSEQLCRDLAAALGLSRFRAEALCQSFARGELEEEAGAVMQEATRYSLRQWLEHLDGGLRRLRDKRAEPSAPLPARLEFLECAPALPFAEPALRSWMEKWLPERFAEVQRFTVKSVPGVSDRTGAAGARPQNLALFALARYAGLLRQPLHPLNVQLRQIAAK
jgi:cell division protein FtsA